MVFDITNKCRWLLPESSEMRKSIPPGCGFWKDSFEMGLTFLSNFSPRGIPITFKTMWLLANTKCHRNVWAEAVIKKGGARSIRRRLPVWHRVAPIKSFHDCYFSGFRFAVKNVFADTVDINSTAEIQRPFRTSPSFSIVQIRDTPTEQPYLSEDWDYYLVLLQLHRGF